jgi:hypothetical protein
MEIALCKLRNKYRARKLKYFCDVDSEPLMQDISNSFNVVAVKLLAAIFRKVRTSRREGGGISKTKFWLSLSLSIAQNPTPFCRHYSLSHQDEPCNLSSVLLNLGQASLPMCLMRSATLCRKCLTKTGTVVSCLMKCQSECQV